jgi:hypothetical protein
VNGSRCEHLHETRQTSTRREGGVNAFHPLMLRLPGLLRNVNGLLITPSAELLRYGRKQTRVLVIHHTSLDRNWRTAEATTRGRIGNL